MTARSCSVILFLCLVSFAFVSCRDKGGTAVIERGIYYWKSSEDSFDSTEINAVKTLEVKKMYVKYFEVEYDNVFGARPTSKSPINFRYADNAAILQAIEIIPVVFIKNEVLKNTAPADIDSLAGNILFLADKRYKEQMLYNEGFAELQIDCDWTASTKDKYFALLKYLKKASGKTISCTLRMYPYKYPELMGVPPVDKVTLMCYNLNNPLEHENKNSILDVAELKKYLDTKKQYPLHLDIVLPINSWMLCFKNNQFAGVLHNREIINNIAIPVKPLWYVVTRDTLVDDMFIRQGDMIKYEEAKEEELQAVARLLKSKLNLEKKTTISFFHLDKTSLNKYSHETLGGLYNSFK